MPGDAQVTLQHRIETQEWVGVCDVTFKTFGRGLISLQKFQQNDIVCDYHGKVVENCNFEEYYNNDDVKMEYCMELVTGPKKRIIDASANICPIHPTNRCLGRLANHAGIRKGLANLKPEEIYIEAMQTKVVVLRARKPIEPFEQLRFDYNDKTAQALFKD